MCLSWYSQQTEAAVTNTIIHLVLEMKTYIFFFFLLRDVGIRRSQSSRSLRRGSSVIPCWDCWFESRRVHVSVVCCQIEVSALPCWDCWFESRRGHVSVVCCQVDVSASSCSPVQRSPTECGAFESGSDASIMGRTWPTGGSCALGRKNNRTFRNFAHKRQSM